MLLNSRLQQSVFVALAAALTLSGCASTTQPRARTPQAAQDDGAVQPASIAPPDFGPAPDFTSEPWLNTEVPLTLAALRGKVVLVEFWTFG